MQINVPKGKTPLTNEEIQRPFSYLTRKYLK